jgi:hypothetical protein
VQASFPNQPLTESDDFERRSRLISLVYEVLRDMKAPPDEATTVAMFSDLSRAFSDKATALAKLEATAPRVSAPKSAAMYSART